MSTWELVYLLPKSLQVTAAGHLAFLGIADDQNRIAGIQVTLVFFKLELYLNLSLYFITLTSCFVGFFLESGYILLTGILQKSYCEFNAL